MQAYGGSHSQIMNRYEDDRERRIRLRDQERAYREELDLDNPTKPSATANDGFWKGLGQDELRRREGQEKQKQDYGAALKQQMRGDQMIKRKHSIPPKPSQIIPSEFQYNDRRNIDYGAHEFEDRDFRGENLRNREREREFDSDSKQRIRGDERSSSGGGNESLYEFSQRHPREVYKSYSSDSHKIFSSDSPNRKEILERESRSEEALRARMGREKYLDMFSQTSPAEYYNPRKVEESKPKEEFFSRSLSDVNQKNPAHKFMGSLSGLYGSKPEEMLRREREQKEQYARDLREQAELNKKRREQELLKERKQSLIEEAMARNYDPYTNGNSRQTQKNNTQINTPQFQTPPQIQTPPSQQRQAQSQDFYQSQDSPRFQIPIITKNEEAVLSPQRSELTRPLNESGGSPSTLNTSLSPPAPKKFMGSISAMHLNPEHARIANEKKEELRRDLEEQMKQKELAKKQEQQKQKERDQRDIREYNEIEAKNSPPKLPIPNNNNSVQSPVEDYIGLPHRRKHAHGMSSSIELSPSAVIPAVVPLQPTQPKETSFLRGAGVPVDEETRQKALRKQKEQQDFLEALQRQKQEKKAIERMEKEKMEARLPKELREGYVSNGDKPSINLPEATTITGGKGKGRGMRYSDAAGVPSRSEESPHTNSNPRGENNNYNLNNDNNNNNNNNGYNNNRPENIPMEDFPDIVPKRPSRNSPLEEDDFSSADDRDYSYGRFRARERGHRHQEAKFVIPPNGMMIMPNIPNLKGVPKGSQAEDALASIAQAQTSMLEEQAKMKVIMEENLKAFQQLQLELKRVETNYERETNNANNNNNYNNYNNHNNYNNTHNVPQQQQQKFYPNPHYRVPPSSLRKREFLDNIDPENVMRENNSNRVLSGESEFIFSEEPTPSYNAGKTVQSQNPNHPNQVKQSTQDHQTQIRSSQLTRNSTPRNDLNSSNNNNNANHNSDINNSNGLGHTMWGYVTSNGRDIKTADPEYPHERGFSQKDLFS